MVQLVKEVSGTKSTEKTGPAKPEDGAMEQKDNAFNSVEKGTIKKDKHGDLGTCCGGCS